MTPYSQTFDTLTSDTYSLRVANAASAATLYSKTGVVLTAGHTYFMGWLNTTSIDAGVLGVCPLDSRAANQITTCTD
jgi:hypothetical protein